MASPDDLKFQDTFSMSGSSSTTPAGATGDIKLDMSDDEGQEESSELLRGEKQTSGFWTFAYYQSFFNVDTMQVLDRVKGSVMPLPGRNFIKHTLQSSPDLYGPFWICVTLVFSLAISGNLSTFLNSLGIPHYHYRPQFHRVTIAAVVIFLYAWLVPLGVWGFLTWRQREERQQRGYSFLETVCVYGYSLFIYIPTSVLWILPFEWLRWLLILVAMVISGSVLVLTFWPVVCDDTKMYFFQTATRTPVPTLAPNHTAAILTNKTH